MQHLPAILLRADFRNLLSSTASEVRTTIVPEGNILSIHDIIISPKSCFNMQITVDTGILVFPLFGGVEMNDNTEDFLGTGSFRVIPSGDADTILFTNAYEEHAVNILVFELKYSLAPFTGTITFPERNQLLRLFDDNHITISAGVFDGRTKSIYKSGREKNNLLMYVINGAFEFEDRLLEARDTLILRGIDEVEFEALSGNAVLLVAALV